MKIENIYPLTFFLQILSVVLQYVFLFLNRFSFPGDKAMAEMSDINVQKLTIVQQAIASCCGAIITSLFGKANNEAGYRENLTN